MTRFLHTVFVTGAVVSGVFIQPEIVLANESDSRLLIVNRDTGHVIYDDGRDDLFCVTRRVIVGYTDEGRPVYRRVMKCR